MSLRAGVLILLVAGLLAAGAMWVFGFAGPEQPVGLIADPADPEYPDLMMVPLDVQGIAIAEDGTWRLRFGATIVNGGDGPLVIGASRRSRLGGWDVRQQLIEPDGSYSEIAIPANLIFGGDGHDHWHVSEIETHWVETLDGQEVGRVLKEGYCFFDNVEFDLGLAGAPQLRQYFSPDCGGRWDRSLTMGLSVGWGDSYPWSMFEQQIDVTGIEEGRYRIRAEADPSGWLVESNESNNGTWTIIGVSIDGDGFPIVDVVEESPLGG